MRSFTLRLAAALSLSAGAAFAQESERKDSAPPEPARAEARQVDVYGDLRHCDWSARLDNFAIELHNDPAAQGYVISYNAGGRHSYAPRQVKVARHYLTESRGLDPSRLVLVEGGVREDLKEGQTELWVVPAGADPPVAPPSADKYAENFSGKFDSFSTGADVYQEIYEMGAADSAISRGEFAAKLKQQPESLGYVVIRTPKGGAPGAWRRYERREGLLLAERGVAASRLRTLDGGYTEGGEVEVELWVLPTWAPPPPSLAEKLEAVFSTAAKLHTLDLDGTTEEDAQRWMLENLAEFLREHPRATALLVAREPTPAEQIEWASEVNSGEAEAAPAEAAPEETAEAARAPEAGEEAAAEEPGEEQTMKGLAEEWKSQLVLKYGIAPHRVNVAEGRAVRWGHGRLNLWVVPEKAKWPDTQARDADEAELEELYGVAPEGGAQAASAPH